MLLPPSKGHAPDIGSACAAWGSADPRHWTNSWDRRESPAARRLGWRPSLVMGIGHGDSQQRRFSLSKFGFDKVSKASGVVVQETLWDGFTHLCRKWINLAYLLMIYLWISIAAIAMLSSQASRGHIATERNINRSWMLLRWSEMDIPTWNCMELPPRCWFLENFRVSEFELVLEGMMKPLRTQICWVGSEFPHTLQHAIAYIYNHIYI